MASNARPVKPITEGNGSGLELKIEVRDGNPVLNNQLIIRRGQDYVVDERLFCRTDIYHRKKLMLMLRVKTIEETRVTELPL